jgi:hypothetical protein
MTRRILSLVALAIVVALPSIAADATKRPTATVVGITNHVSKTCSNMVRGNVFREPDGGYHESPQGWFYKAEVHQSTSWALAYCYYGLDQASPANRPVYSVHYELTGFKSNQCTVSAATITCSSMPVLKP